MNQLFQAGVGPAANDTGGERARARSGPGRVPPVPPPHGSLAARPLGSDRDDGALQDLRTAGARPGEAGDTARPAALIDELAAARAVIWPLLALVAARGVREYGLPPWASEPTIRGLLVPEADARDLMDGLARYRAVVTHS